MKANLKELYLELSTDNSNNKLTTRANLIEALNLKFSTIMQHYNPSNDLEVVLDDLIGSVRLCSYMQGVVNNANLFGPHELVVFSRYNHWIDALAKQGSGSTLKFIDVGANVGLHSIIVKKLTHCRVKLEILCLEPIEEVSLVRMKNFEINGVTGVQNISGALVPEIYEERYVSFIMCIDNFTASTTSLTGKSIYGGRNEISVPAIKPSVLFETLSLEQDVDYLVKVDIEGAEASFIEDALPMVLDLNPRFSAFVIEVSTAENAARILSLINRYPKKVRAYSDIISYSSKISKVSDIPMDWRKGSLYIEICH